MRHGLRLPTEIITSAIPRLSTSRPSLDSQAYLKPRAEEIRQADKALENIQAGKFGKKYAQGMAVELRPPAIWWLWIKTATSCP